MIFSAGVNKSHLRLWEAVARREKRAEELNVSLEGRLTPAGGLAPGSCFNYLPSSDFLAGPVAGGKVAVPGELGRTFVAGGWGL